MHAQKCRPAALQTHPMTRWLLKYQEESQENGLSTVPAAPAEATEARPATEAIDAAAQELMGLLSPPGL